VLTQNPVIRRDRFREESPSRILDVRTRRILSLARATWLAHSTRCNKDFLAEPGICRRYVGIFLFLAWQRSTFKSLFQSEHLVKILGNTLAVRSTEREDNNIGEPVKPRVLIADDHRLVVEGIVKIVEAECEIVGVVSNGREVIAAALEKKPDVILLDVTMPLLNGIEAARQIKRERPNIKIVFVTMQLNRDYVREAFEAGASGYVLKQAAASELMTAIQEVQEGRFFLSPMISERYLENQVLAGKSPVKLFSSLTPRQREVLQLVAEGKHAKEIASLLYISVKTVEFHKKHLLTELSLRNTPELIRYAVEHGWVGS
jgi:DNA-binding NarL/FixJ family response regulator